MQDGLLVTEVDLNLIQQIKDKWCFPVGLPQSEKHTHTLSLSLDDDEA